MNHQSVSNEQSPQTAHSWKLQDAKARFSELVRLATDSGPQHVTVNGQPKVVVLSETEYEHLRGQATGQQLIDLLRESPLAEVDIEHARVSGPVRDVAL
ncbi:type II toxin-antitoxin system prevent-host-death family antitoxin [Thiorhodovibrio frisius]|uniref:Antitoxin n=1 Tax=Thiorhodovibrio frisius TaxID=631362 RepID=H8Z6B3_9GAMM|nr:type II toxin-antitoxin system prevent-host-death family antitoxin [Thiorhodovibrio frisius]EIC20697.1 prevent-host-death family protein [Thiorhodovibrio frisius]WPL21445.1 prevent-host-death family protein [Thiorhodovibrio frisius]